MCLVYVCVCVYKHTGTAKHHVEVQTVDTNGRVVLDAQVNVLLNAEAEIAGSGEVLTAQLVFAHLQATLEDLLGLGTANGAMDGDLLVTTNAKRAHGVASLREDGLLAGQLFQHLKTTERLIEKRRININPIAIGEI